MLKSNSASYDKSIYDQNDYSIAIVFKDVDSNVNEERKKTIITLITISGPYYECHSFVIIIEIYRNAH